MFHRASCVGGQRLKSTTAFVSCRERWRAMRGKNNEKKCFAITMEFRLQNFLWDIFIAFVSLTRRWKRHENWQRGETRTRMAENFYATENYVAISSKKTQKIGKFLCLKFDHVREGFLAWCRVCVYVSRLVDLWVSIAPYHTHHWCQKLGCCWSRHEMLSLFIPGCRSTWNSLRVARLVAARTIWEKREIFPATRRQ